MTTTTCNALMAACPEHIAACRRALEPVVRHPVTRAVLMLVAALAIALMAYGEHWVLAEAPAQPLEGAAASCITDLLDNVSGAARPAGACLSSEPASTQGHAI